MDKDNIFKSCNFYLDDGDTVHILIKDLVETLPVIELVDDEGDVEDGYYGGDPVIHDNDILLNTTSGPTDVYLYNPAIKVSTLLTIPSLDTAFSSPDIAHTNNKLWLYRYNTVTFHYDIREYNITFIPFTISYNRDITLFSLQGNAGLCAINDTKLIGIYHEDAINTKVYECDITNNISVDTYKFNILPNSYVSGDYILTTTNKLIVTLLNATTAKYYIYQYDYLTGNLDITKEITAIATRPYGIFEYEDEIYIAAGVGVWPADTGEIYKIDKTAPYNLTLVDTVPYGINGASQVPEQLTVHFT